jgi:hypothetical protein
MRKETAADDGKNDGNKPFRYGNAARPQLFYPEEYPDIIAEEARRLWGV